MKTLGVVGGLGPMATAYFMQLVITMTEASTDQEHIRMYIASNPAIPDRTRFILGESNDSPINGMVYEGKFLKNAGADIIAIPCVTAHFFHQKLEKEIGLPVVNVMEETGRYLKERGICKAGLMATDGTVRSLIFQKAMSEFGIDVITPDSEGQKLVMDIIYKDVKAGREVNMTSFSNVSKSLKEKGAEVVILGCTELSIIKRDHVLKAGYLDVLDVLAMKVVAECGKLRKEYYELISR